MVARMKRKGPWPAASAFLRGVLRHLDRIEVVDVGANPIEGDAPYRRLLDQGLCHVTGFEPQEGPLAALNARKSVQETYLPHALGAGGAADLHLFHHSGFTSLFAVDPKIAAFLGFNRATRETEVVQVETLRLDDVPGLERIDYLKIDVQGAEAMIIAGGAARLAETMLIQTEVRFVPLYAGEPCFAGLDAELQRQGFLFHDFAFLKRVNLRSPSAGSLRPSVKRQVVDGDAYYLRDLSDLSKISDTQLFRLALLADQVMEDAALVLFCLDALEERRSIGRQSAARFAAALPAAMRAET
jgi:FkbM family methyltransferase